MSIGADETIIDDGIDLYGGIIAETIAPLAHLPEGVEALVDGINQ